MSETLRCRGSFCLARHALAGGMAATDPAGGVAARVFGVHRGVAATRSCEARLVSGFGAGFGGLVVRAVSLPVDKFKTT